MMGAAWHVSPLLVVLLAWMVVTGQSLTEEAVTSGEEDASEVIHHDEPSYAVLFPSFTLTIGFVTFFILSRYMRALPYTAVMFLIGAIMGIGTGLSDSFSHVSETLRMWLGINYEVLLLVFLPGLLFKDSYGLNVHLFMYSFWQLLIFAFPLVLAGTVLGALVGFYIFPWGWSFNLAMTVGSILAATDPVAVAALLEEVGAPPRLKVHIAGESLLNDGSAIVFFSIFIERYLKELEIQDSERKSTFAEGSLYSVKNLWELQHREENVVQVATVTGLAYLNYYVADFVWATSGVIATVTAGVVVRLFGRALVNDLKLLEDFLTILEHILNTLIFTLGGAVWGNIIALEEKSGVWGGREWGYLILLYVLLHVIRVLQFVAIYPITVRIGLKTNWKETAFTIFAGLRGALGITLAIALDNRVAQATGGRDETIHEIHTQQAFACIGGVAFLTLVVNSLLAGPLLRKLGLSDSSEARLRIVKSYTLRYRSALIDDMVRLLCQDRFRRVSFQLVKHYVPILRDLTKSQLLQAVAANKATTDPQDYQPPHLSNIAPYVIDDTDEHNHEELRLLEEEFVCSPEVHDRNARMAIRSKDRSRRTKSYSASNLRSTLDADFLSAPELRMLFISILKVAYEFQIEHGELEDSHVLAVTLEQSLDLALSRVSSGEKLTDWEILHSIHQPLVDIGGSIKNFFAKVKYYTVPAKQAQLASKSRAHDMVIERAFCFMAAHRSAQASFAYELQNADSELSEAAKVILDESEKQYQLAEASLKNIDDDVLDLAVSHKFCRILLNIGVGNIEKLVSLGMMKETEAEHLIKEIEENLHELNHHVRKHKDPSSNGESKGQQQNHVSDGEIVQEEQVGADTNAV